MCEIIIINIIIGKPKHLNIRVYSIIYEKKGFGRCKNGRDRKIVE